MPKKLDKLDEDDFEEEPEPLEYEADEEDDEEDEEEDEEEEEKKQKKKQKKPKNWVLQKTPEVFTVINPKTKEIIAQALNREDLELQLLIIAAQKSTETAISMN